MSRGAAGDVVELKPSNNVYTVLVAVAIIAQVLAFLSMFMKANEIFEQGKTLFN